MVGQASDTTASYCMETFYHYTDAKGIEAILESGKILKQEGNGHYTLGEAVFLTKVNNY